MRNAECGTAWGSGLLALLLVVVASGCRKTGGEDVREQQRVEQPGAEKADVRPQPPPTRPKDLPAPDAGTARVEPAPTPPEAPVEPPPLSGISWSMDPKQLDVMRDTIVRLNAEWKGARPEDYSCQWDPGDRTGVVSGCSAEHRFAGGLADRIVKLTILFGGKELFSDSMDLRLERLPVVPLPTGPAAVPDPPPPDKGIRAAMLGLFAPPDEQTSKAILAALRSVRPGLILVFVNYPATAADIRTLSTTLAPEGLEAIVPVLCSGGDLVLPLDPKLVQHGEDSQPPYRAAFLHGSTLFVVLDPRVRNLSPDQEKWMLDHLEKGKVAAHRIVVSCLPLESYTGSGAELQPQFRYYEKLLRGDVTLFASSSDPVYYYGSYGLVRTVSAGSASGAAGRLAASDKVQPSLLALVDLVSGSEPRVEGVPLLSPDQTLDPLTLPAKLGAYERR